MIKLIKVKEDENIMFCSVQEENLSKDINIIVESEKGLSYVKTISDVKEYEEICTVVYSFYIQYENVCLERLVEVIIKMFKTKDTIENISEKQIMDEVYKGEI